MQSAASFELKIHACTACPRLRKHCLEVAKTKRRAYENQEYWGKPVAPFGDPKASLLVVGLAPGAHGANRTGRIFTGDRSGDWLYRALHRAGFANQPLSVSRTDGLALSHARVTCVVKCAPPDNKPTTLEIHTCIHRFFDQEITSHPEVRVYIALGRLAWDSIQKQFKVSRRVAFKHGAEQTLPEGKILLASYHPSQQNTFTGRLTEAMFDSVFARAGELLNLLKDV
jgi:uracil-DNA glycosylase family 4